MYISSILEPRRSIKLLNIHELRNISYVCARELFQERETHTRSLIGIRRRSGQCCCG